MRISGPVNVTVLSHKNSLQNTITIFGDYHFSTENKCSPCRLDHNCMSINKYLLKLYNEKNHDHIDFFIESPFIPKHSRIKSAKEKTENYSAVMGSLIHEFGKCLVANKECKYNDRNKRLHYIDIRYNEYYFYIIEKLRSIYSSFKSDISSAQKNKEIPKIGMIGVLHGIYKNGEKKIAPHVFFKMTEKITTNKTTFCNFVKLFYLSDNIHQDITNLLGTSIVSTLFTHKQKISKVRKQLLKVPIEVRELMIDFIEKKLEKFYATIDFNKVKQIKLLFDSKNHTESKLTILYNVAYEIEFLLTDVGVYLVDLYTIARMWYYNNVFGSKIISFVGDMHSDNYREFFKKYAKMHVVHEEKIKKIDPNKSLSTNNVNRCVMLNGGGEEENDTASIMEFRKSIGSNN